MEITVHLADQTVAELGDLLRNSQGPTVSDIEGIEDLISLVLLHIADGWRRPGSWERRILEQMGLA